MATVSVRYIVDDVDAAIAFYRDDLGFTEIMHPAPAFADDVARGPAPGAQRAWRRAPAGDRRCPTAPCRIQAAGSFLYPVELFEPTAPEARMEQRDSSGSGRRIFWPMCRSWPGAFVARVESRPEAGPLPEGNEP
jgi:catechol 2,3-dioxygenase-like lactoylglutathione lyase family enzyme